VQLWRSPHGNIYMLQGPPVLHNGEQPTFVLRPRSPAAAAALSALHAAVQDGAAGTVAAARPAPGAAAANTFDQKTDAASAHLYFYYYGQLMHQQNMLQDYIRTGTYYSAITENAGDFAGKAVMDVGCGSGILSLFAAQAGARVVYAVEASDAARFAARLAEANPAWGRRVVVLHGKVEEVEVPEKVDVLVSEPMGTLLVNERMIETYLYARDRHLKPGGKASERAGERPRCAAGGELHRRPASAGPSPQTSCP
jgi:histone-arginine methyltransferase CARM1